MLDACHPVDPAKVVRGQYTAGFIDGQSVRGYREEPGVSPGSTTETYAALRLDIDSWRWAGVPFLLRTGKRLQARESRVTIAFKDVPFHLFTGASNEHPIHSNHLVIRVQPDEGIAFTFVAKQPGPEVRTQRVRMDFAYGNSFKTSPPEAYERLLHDVLHRDHTLFIREDEVERGWALVEPVLQQTVVEHWDGSAWSIVPSPNPGGNNSLYDLAIVSPTGIWAVGSFIPPGGGLLDWHSLVDPGEAGVTATSESPPR